MARKSVRPSYSEDFEITALDDKRNRLMRIFDVATHAASQSPLTNERINSKGVKVSDPMFTDMGRVRDEVFAEPTNLYATQLENLDALIRSEGITADKFKKALGAFNSRTKSQLDKHRYGAGLDVHHAVGVASTRKALNHLDVEEQGQHLFGMTQRGFAGNTHLTADHRTYLKPEHNAAHLNIVSGVPLKSDGMRNMGDMSGMRGSELLDHFFSVSGDMQTKLADNASEFAGEARQRYAEELGKINIDVKPEQLGSAIILPGSRVSVSNAIANETEKRIGKKGMKELTNKVERMAYPDGIATIFPGLKKTTFSTPAQIGRSQGQETRAEIENIRRKAIDNNTDGITLHPGSMEEFCKAIDIQRLINVLGIKQ